LCGYGVVALFTVLAIGRTPEPNPSYFFYKNLAQAPYAAAIESPNLVFCMHATVSSKRHVQAGATGELPKDENIAIASRVRTKPSAVERLAHTLPGRNTHGDQVKWGVDTKLRNQIQLSTYADCIGENLGDLRTFTDRYVPCVSPGYETDVLCACEQRESKSIHDCEFPLEQ
jgi:hypothetical protein